MASLQSGVQLACTQTSASACVHVDCGAHAPSQPCDGELLELEFLGEMGLDVTVTEPNARDGSSSAAAAQRPNAGCELQSRNGTGGAIDLCTYSAHVTAAAGAHAPAPAPPPAPLQQAACEKLQLQREKNKAAQARVREKKRTASATLERKKADTQTRIAETTARARHARALREHLLKRSSDASGALIAHLSSRPLPPAPSSGAPPHQPTPAQALVATSHRRAGLYTSRSSEQRAVDTFGMHAALRYEAIAEHAGLHYPRARTAYPPPSSGGGLDADDSANLRSHVQAYQAAVAEQRGVRLADVCWFVQLPYEVSPGLALSMSPQLGSPECVASAAVYHMLSLLECMLVTAEREELAQRRIALLGSGAATKARSLDAPTSPPPPPPGSSDLTRTAATQQPDACLRCGVAELTSRVDATHYMLRSLLSHYYATLPLATWSRAVRNMIRYVDMVGAIALRIRAHDRDGVAAEARPARWDDADGEAGFWKTLVAMGAAMLAFYSALKHEAAAERPEAAGWKLSSCASLQDVDACLAANATRLQALQRGKLLGQCVCLMHAPRLIRQVEGGGVCLDMYPGLTVAQIEELNLAIYRALRLSASQRRELARVWLTWKHLRRLLEDNLECAAKPLQELPDASCVPPSWLAFIDDRSGWQAGARVWEANEKPDDSLDWARTLVGVSAAHTAAAERALSGLRRFSDEDAEMYAYTLMLRNSPGKCVSSEQFAIYFAVQVERGLLVGDWFRIAQLAAQEVRQCTLLGLGTLDSDCSPYDVVAPRAVQEA